MVDARSATLKREMAEQGRPHACFCEAFRGMRLYAEGPTDEYPDRTSVTLDWDHELEMLGFGQERATMSPAEARSLADKLRHAGDCTLRGAAIRESVFLEQDGFGELSVVTGCVKKFSLCFGDGGHSFAKFSEITTLSVEEGNLLATMLDAAVDAIEALLSVAGS